MNLSNVLPTLPFIFENFYRSEYHCRFLSALFMSLLIANADTIIDFLCLLLKILEK